eukprot:5444737-Alexandrium_andersonii.AAC.1
MSASLVGSEMCIRDRWYAVPAAPCAESGAWCVARGVRCVAWARGEWFGAVSYTHLTLPTICSV